MHDHARRMFAKQSFNAVAALAAGTALLRPAFAKDAADVKFAQDPANLQAGLETAHTPRITLDKLDSMEVAFGKTPAGTFYRINVQARHEATQAHHIFGIALYVNGEIIAEHTMTQALAEASLPATAFLARLKTGDVLLAVTTCNVHGKWGSRTSV
ncbi:MAG: desulfoferrodoxin family protein [Pseudomonadota bacterium]